MCNSNYVLLLRIEIIKQEIKKYQRYVMILDDTRKDGGGGDPNNPKQRKPKQRKTINSFIKCL